MKTLKRLLFFIAGVGLLIACSKSDHFWGNEPLGRTDDPEPVMINIPFKADFITFYTNVYPEPSCGDNPPWDYRVIVDVDGTATHLGKISGRLEFCCDMSTGIYKDAVGSFVAANGDELFINSWGKVIDGKLPEHPWYVISWWKDPFEFVGGTGRFEGATGGGMTDSFNSSEDDVAHHHWTGTLTLPKGKE